MQFIHAATNVFIHKQKYRFMFYFDCLQTEKSVCGIEIDVNYVSLFFL